MKHLVVSLSIALNIILIFVLTMSFDSETPGSVQARAPMPADRKQVFSGDPKTLRQQLDTIGLNDAVSKAAVLARVLELANESSQVDSRYWRYTSTTRHEQALARTDMHDMARARLLAIYGPRAKTDPDFRSLFRPLDQRFSFLSPDEQVSVQRLQIEFSRDLALAAAKPQGHEDTRSGEFVAVINAPHYEQFLDALTKLIGPKATLEYELRESPLANQLRSSDLSFTEEQYRGSFQILRSLDRARPDRDEYLAARTQLRNVLGDNAFTKLSAARDARFAVISRAGHQENLSEDRILSAYQILNDGQEALLRTLSKSEHDPERRATTIKELQSEQQRRLGELVGDSVAKRLWQALTEQSIASREGLNPL